MAKSSTTPGALDDARRLDMSASTDALQLVSQLLAQEDLSASDLVVLAQFHWPGRDQNSIYIVEKSLRALLQIGDAGHLAEGLTIQE